MAINPPNPRLVGLLKFAMVIAAAKFLYGILKLTVWDLGTFNLFRFFACCACAAMLAAYTLLPAKRRDLTKLILFGGFCELVNDAIPVYWYVSSLYRWQIAHSFKARFVAGELLFDVVYYMFVAVVIVRVTVLQRRQLRATNSTGDTIV